MKPEEFEDIKIEAVDKEKTHFHVPNNPFCDIYLQMSNVIPEKWEEFFYGEWHSVNYPMKSTGHVVVQRPQHLVIQCNYGDLEAYHLKFLEEVIETTNSLYQQWLNEESPVNPQQEDSRLISDLEERVNKQLKFKNK